MGIFDQLREEARRQAKWDAENGPEAAAELREKLRKQGEEDEAYRVWRSDLRERAKESRR